MGKRRLLLPPLLLLLLASSAIEFEREAEGGKGGTLRSIKDCNQQSALNMAIPAMLVALQQRANHSWLLQLRPDPRQQKFAPNRKSREVFSGHFVEVAPTPLPQPSLIIHRWTALPPPPLYLLTPKGSFFCISAEMAAELGLDHAAVASDAFLQFFSGTIDALPGAAITPSPFPPQPLMLL
jgi:hypothetical protein